MTEAAQSRRIRAIGSLLVGIAVVGVLLAGVLAALSVAAPASAHAALTASDPAEGATVSADLDRVTLTFTEAPLAGLDARTPHRGPRRRRDGRVHRDVDVSGTAMSKAVTLSAGPHTVLWRYVSPDGHPIDGQVAFTVTAAPAPSASSTVPSPGPSSAATPAASSRSRPRRPPWQSVPRLRPDRSPGCSARSWWHCSAPPSPRSPSGCADAPAGPRPRPDRRRATDRAPRVELSALRHPLVRGRRGR